MRYFVDISTIRTASSAPPRGVTRVEYNVAREALGLGAKLVRFDEGARAFVAAELPTDFGRAHDEIALLLSETPTIRAPLLKRPGLGRARALGKSLALAALAASEAGLETARKELAWRLAYNFEFLAVAECFELASHAGALPPQPLCHEFHYWITVERGKHHASNEPGTAPPMEFTNRDKLLSLGAVWKPEYIDGLEGLASRGVTVTALIYDMIPITHTGFLPSEEMDRFKIYLERMLRSNIRLTTISRSSRQEIAKYAQNTLGLCKDVAVTPLASSASTDRAKVSAALLKAGLQDREFVFMAGSIEPRKNQGFRHLSGGHIASRQPSGTCFRRRLGQGRILARASAKGRRYRRRLVLLQRRRRRARVALRELPFHGFSVGGRGLGLADQRGTGPRQILPGLGQHFLERGGGRTGFPRFSARSAGLEDELYKLLSDPRVLGARSKRIREMHRPRSWADVSGK